jgi:hypothetical protein
VPWPSKFVAIYLEHDGVDMDGPPVKGALACWDLESIKYAFTNGCGWGNWRCQHYDAAWHNDGDSTERAGEVLAWAHEQEGCPCTCEADDNAGN